MKPPAFDYVRAEDLDEALAALDAHGDDAKVLAGGQSLVAMLNMRLVSPQILVDISRIGALDRIAREDGRVQIGAGVTQGRLAGWEAIEAELPLVAHALAHVGHYQTRARGTVCGSLAHGDPSSELPLCLATLGGEVVLRRSGATRIVDAASFQTGMLETACAPEEIVESVRFPARRPGEGQAFAEFARRHGDFAIVAVAATARGEDVTLGVGGVADRPYVARWPALAPDDVGDALEDLVEAIPAADGGTVPAAYRARLVRALGRRVIEEARACRA